MASKKYHRWADIKHKGKSPERIAAIERLVKDDILELELRELRELSGMTQVEAAEIAEMTQAQLSRIERRDDHLVSTIRRYVEALGGTVEVVAVLGNKRVALTGV